MAYKKHRTASRRRSGELIIKPGRETNICLENCGGWGRMERVQRRAEGLGREVLRGGTRPNAGKKENADDALTYSEGIKQAQDGPVVLHDARLLDALDKLLLLHVLFRQLEALDGALLVPIVVAGALSLLVPLHPADETLQFGLPVRLGGYFQNYYCYDQFDAK